MIPPVHLQRSQAAGFPEGITQEQVGRLSFDSGLIDPNSLFTPVYCWNVVAGAKQDTPGWTGPGRGPMPQISRYTPPECMVWCHYESIDGYGSTDLPWTERNVFIVTLPRPQIGASSHLGNVAHQRCDNARAEAINLTDWKNGVTLVRLSSEVASPHVCLVDTAALRAVLARAEWKGQP